MAILTSTPSDVTLSLSRFSNSKSDTISWDIPTIPDGVTINSCTLTGTATASSTDITSITINDESIDVSTSGTLFTIDLGTDTTISLVDCTAKKSGTSSYNVTFTNMSYIIDYSDPIKYTVIFKDYDGRVLSTQEISQGNSATAPEEPTRDGYTFIKWDTNFSNVTSDLVVTAQYEYGVLTKTTYYVTDVESEGELRFVLCSYGTLEDMSKDIFLEALKNDDEKYVYLGTDEYLDFQFDNSVFLYINNIEEIENVSSATLFINATVGGYYTSEANISIEMGSFSQDLASGANNLAIDVKDYLNRNSLQISIHAMGSEAYTPAMTYLVSVNSVRLEITCSSNSSQPSEINNIKIGDSNISKISIGDKTVSAMYLGNNKIFG